MVSALGVVRRWAAGGMAMSAVSDVAAAPLRRVLGDAGPVSVLPNGIDVEAWRPQGPRPDDGVVRFVTAMRLANRKRPVPLMRVMRQVRALVPAGREIALEVLGEGPDRGSVERYLAEHGMASWVSLPGRVPRTSVRDRYASADVYISPARLESFGIAALEARTSGLPVVARSGSGVGEFVTDGVNGFLADDDESMARGARAAGLRRHAARADARSQPRPGARAGLAAGGRAGRGGVPARGRGDGSRVSGTALWVVGVDASGVERVRERLGHGDDPVRLLARKGYATGGPSSVVGEANPHTVTVVYRCPAVTCGGDAGSAAGSGGPVGDDEPGAVPRDPGMVLEPGEEPVVLQRVAVYAVVRSERGVLLAQNSARTNAAGTWGLAGGGLDLGELPEAALHREIWEETGQRVDITGIAVVTTRHWVGRAPNRRLEDFHAVRLVYRAECPEPTDPGGARRRRDDGRGGVVPARRGRPAAAGHGDARDPRAPQPRRRRVTIPISPRRAQARPTTTRTLGPSSLRSATWKPVTWFATTPAPTSPKIRPTTTSPQFGPLGGGRYVTCGRA